MPSLKTKLGKVELKNPVLLASGTCGIVGKEFEPYFDLKDLGGIVTKSLSIKPREGNITPRVTEVKPNLGMLNSIGLQNPGVDKFLEDDINYLREKEATTIVNIVGESLDDYLEALEKIKDRKEITAVELNLSCPNVDGGLDFSQDPKKAEEVVKKVKAIIGFPVFAKLSPNVTDITAIAKGCIDGGADGLSMINTLIGMVIDIEKKKPALPRKFAGYSGPAIRPVALRMVYQVHAKFPNVPIIGIGGIMNSEDAIEFLLAGASAVQIGTASFVNPKASVEIVSGIENYLEKNGFSSVEEIIGLANKPN